MLNNLLVIDDNKDDLNLVKHYLKKRFPDSTIASAGSVSEYHEKLNWMNPDVIICDYQLPDGTGLDILIHNKANQNTPFIFLTGILNDEEKVASAVLRGAAAYVLKENVSIIGSVVTTILEERNKAESIAQKMIFIKDRIEYQCNKALELLSQGKDFKDVSACIESIKAEVSVV